MDNDERVEIIIIDVTEIRTSKELHAILKKELDFPTFYGMNWDAFWDTITGLVELPEKLVIKGWDNIVKALPNDAEIMKRLLDKFNEDYSICKCTVEYK